MNLAVDPVLERNDNLPTADRTTRQYSNSNGGTIRFANRSNRQEGREAES